jgi:hypothetical protein
LAGRALSFAAVAMRRLAAWLAFRLAPRLAQAGSKAGSGSKAGLWLKGWLKGWLLPAGSKPQPKSRNSRPPPQPKSRRGNPSQRAEKPPSAEEPRSRMAEEPSMPRAALTGSPHRAPQPLATPHLFQPEAARLLLEADLFGGSGADSSQLRAVSWKPPPRTGIERLNSHAHNACASTETALCSVAQIQAVVMFTQCHLQRAQNTRSPNENAACVMLQLCSSKRSVMRARSSEVCIRRT